MPSEEGPGYEKEEEVDIEKRRESEEEVLDRGDSQESEDSNDLVQENLQPFTRSKYRRKMSEGQKSSTASTTGGPSTSASRLVGRSLSPSTSSSSSLRQPTRKTIGQLSTGHWARSLPETNNRGNETSGGNLARGDRARHSRVAKLWQNITRSTANKRLEEKRQKLEEFLNFEIQYLEKLSLLMTLLEEMAKSREPGHPVPMPVTLLEGRDKMVESSLPEIHRLHKDVICPGLSDNLYKPKVMMEMFESQAEKIKTVYTKYLGDHMKVSHIVKTHSVYFKTLAKHANLKVYLDSLFNEPNMHLTRYHLYFEALIKMSNEDEAQTYRKLHARARETSLKVNNRLILSRIKGVPDEVDIFKQGDLTLKGPLGCRVPKKTGFGPAFLAMMTKKASIEPVEVFFFQQSVIICHGKGKRGQTGTFDQYNFYARFPMNLIQCEDYDQSLSLDITLKAQDGN